MMGIFLDQAILAQGVWLRAALAVELSDPLILQALEDCHAFFLELALWLRQLAPAPVAVVVPHTPTNKPSGL